MAQSPKINEDKMLKVQSAWRNLAPTKTFGGMRLEDFDIQVGKSLAPRQRLLELEDEKLQQQALRDSEDEITMDKIEFIVAGVIADPTEGSDSALYEAMGYVRKSERKSGLTRKKKEPSEPEE